MKRSEKVPVKVFPSNSDASVAVAERIAEIIRKSKKLGRSAVLGLATGHTPLGVYRELIRMHQQEGLDFSSVITFNLDEYWPISHDSIQSYHAWMQSNFFSHINIKPENTHILSGEIDDSEIEAHCREFEKMIKDLGGLDLQILGIGRTGHIGFNEPGSSATSRTRRIELDRVTRMDAASDFFGEENVPRMALTMGIGTILDAREIILMGFGEHKAPIIKSSVEGEVTSNVSASYLQRHPAVTFYLDPAAAAELTRFATPWLLVSCDWDDLLVRQAVIWLAKKVDKPVLKLTDEDYGENGLGELSRLRNGAYNVNLEVFRHLMHTITGWPGGKDGPQKIMVFSPHPDDDVICMAGTMMRLVQQGHDLHTAYMVSGCLSVFDYDVMRYADFAGEFNRVFGLAPKTSAEIEERIDRVLRRKRAGELDSPEVQDIKALIRRTEAMAAARFCGIPEENIHFLDLPFYNTGLVQKNPIGPDDMLRTLALLEEVQPDVIFAAGDMSDPHGTHRQCLDALMQALDEYQSRGHKAPKIWLYRGAWQEWPANTLDMVVPLSPDELKRKRFSIFRHESQKDRAMFPGPYDSREFWQRAEDRNRQTAETYDALGLPEYQALEAFALWPLKKCAQAVKQMENVELSSTKVLQQS